MAKLVIAGRAFDSQEAYVRGGRRCGTPQHNDFQKERIRAHVRTARASGMDSASLDIAIDVPVHFHVIHDAGTGKLTDTDIDKQLDVLNAAYSPHKISFSKASLDHTDDAVWFKMTMGSPAERKAKTALGKQTDRALNFYTAEIGAGLLGWATFPSDFAGDPVRDGVVILMSSFPGGSSTPYDMGLTAVHEVGHWLGLYHTFEGGCTLPGDEVGDTPSEASPNYGPANAARNSCSNDPGNDPTTNYMDYTDDAGMTEFTSGQVTRMREQVTLYRARLLGGQATPTDGARGAIDFETGDF
jgi:hypothetical protein